MWVWRTVCGGISRFGHAVGTHVCLLSHIQD